MLKKLFIKDYTNTNDPNVRNQYGKVAGIFGIITNLILGIGKLIIGNISHSVSIMADAINNISDKHSNYLELTIGVRHFLSDFIFRNSIKKFTRLHPNIHLNIVLYSKLDVEKFEKEYDIVIDYLDYTSLIENGKKELLCSLENIIVCGKKLFNIYI